ncbi:BON domain-containing protein [Pseudolysinimonas sp.]|uniref:BON domain-containing protein n=1 Tax=Pseudolysinimonas sp. TaxID=2680009 RepID=UPI003F7E988E
MKAATLNRTDHEIQKAVQDELDWTPDVDAAGIGVAVENGSVTLSGEVDSYMERVAATRAALRVRGVAALADELVVNPPASGLMTDSAIAKAIESAFEWSATIPPDVKAKVHAHHVTLTGHADWDYQRAAARRVVSNIRGVIDVTDLIELTPRVSASETSRRIHAALVRNADLDAGDIHVTTAGTTVTLSGVVKSLAERRQAATAAWASPHVTAVTNNLMVVP